MWMISHVLSKKRKKSITTLMIIPYYHKQYSNMKRIFFFTVPKSPLFHRLFYFHLFIPFSLLTIEMKAQLMLWVLTWLEVGRVESILNFSMLVHVKDPGHGQVILTGAF